MMQLFILIVLLGADVSAQEVPCKTRIESTDDALNCAEARSPETQRALLELKVSKGQTVLAEQWRNPELGLEAVSGTENKSETGLSLGFPIELGGKISARRELAASEIARAEAAYVQVRTEVRNATLLKLHRLRQIAHEQEVIEESISTFSKLVSQYSNRFKLSPEQEISVSVFKMSKSEYDLKRTEILAELNALETYFRTSIGSDISSLKAAIPKAPSKWPTVGAPASSEAPTIKLAEAERSRAQAQLSVAKSESWPTIVVGPSVKLQNEAGKNNQLAGFNLSLPLPIFNTNGPAKAVAVGGIQIAETNLRLVSTAVEKGREELAKTYQQSVSTLKQTLSHEDIEGKHESIEKLFFRGIVPSSLVIESHRTYVELEKARNERELKAIEAWLAISALDGKSQGEFK